MPPPSDSHNPLPVSDDARVRDDEIQPYDSDHTALVHVLWEARRRGWTLDDFDKVAALIMRSKWIRAVRLHALEDAPAREALEAGER